MTIHPKRSARRNRACATVGVVIAALIIPNLAVALDNGGFEEPVTPDYGWSSTPEGAWQTGETCGTPPYEGPRHFDAHAYRTEDAEGVWEFARGCMRTYKILVQRAVAFDADPEVRDIVAELHDEVADPLLGRFSADKARRLKEVDFQPDRLAQRGLCYERLDQIMTEHLLGARGT